MTPEEISETKAVLKKAIEIANRHGMQIMDECNDSASVSAVSAAIMLSTLMTLIINGTAMSPAMRRTIGMMYQSLVPAFSRRS